MFRIINETGKYLHETRSFGQTICQGYVYIFGNMNGYEHRPYVANLYSDALSTMTRLRHKEKMKIVEN